MLAIRLRLVTRWSLMANFETNCSIGSAGTIRPGSNPLANVSMNAAMTLSRFLALLASADRSYRPAQA
jgi:hypothetical protein